MSEKMGGECLKKKSYFFLNSTKKYFPANFFFLVFFSVKELDRIFHFRYFRASTDLSEIINVTLVSWNRLSLLFEGFGVPKKTTAMYMTLYMWRPSCKSRSHWQISGVQTLFSFPLAPSSLSGAESRRVGKLRSSSWSLKKIDENFSFFVEKLFFQTKKYFFILFFLPKNMFPKKIGKSEEKTWFF